jgi:hypothetical protein
MNIGWNKWMERAGATVAVAALAAATMALAVGDAQAAKFRTLHSFGGGDGMFPVAQAAMTTDSAGNLYGTNQ